MTISLTPEMDELVQKQIAGGRFASAEQVVEQSLRALDALETSQDVELAALDAMLTERLAEAARGEFVDSDELWAELKQMSADRRAAQA